MESRAILGAGKPHFPAAAANWSRMEQDSAKPVQHHNLHLPSLSQSRSSLHVAHYALGGQSTIPAEKVDRCLAYAAVAVEDASLSELAKLVIQRIHWWQWNNQSIISGWIARLNAITIFLKKMTFGTIIWYLVERAHYLLKDIEKILDNVQTKLFMVLSQLKLSKEEGVNTLHIWILRIINSIVAYGKPKDIQKIKISKSHYKEDDDDEDDEEDDDEDDEEDDDEEDEDEHKHGHEDDHEHGHEDDHEHEHKHKHEDDDDDEDEEDDEDEDDDEDER